MRLFDDIRHKGDDFSMYDEYGRRHTQLLSDCQVIVADNVTEYFYAGNAREEWNLARDFPNLIPPFRKFWIETRKPSHIVSDVHGIKIWERERPTRWGALFWADRIAKGSVPEPVIVQGAPWMHSGFKEMWEAHGAASRTGGWVITAKLMLDTIFAGIDAVWEFKFVVDADGNLVLPDEAPNGIPAAGFKRYDPANRACYYSAASGWCQTLVNQMWAINPETGTISEGDVGGLDFQRVDNQRTMSPTDIATDMIAYLKPLLLAISFLHCKNVTRVANDPPPKLQRKHARNGRPLCRYYTLKVEPFAERVVHPGASEPTGIKQSFHIVRGHIKRYTAERPLMGKHVGSYFWAAHVAGSKQRGVVAKDYEVIDESHGEGHGTTAGR